MLVVEQCKVKIMADLKLGVHVSAVLMGKEFSQLLVDLLPALTEHWALEETQNALKIEILLYCEDQRLIKGLILILDHLENT